MALEPPGVEPADAEPRPSVSVVIPVLNEAERLPALLRSLARQTLPALEVLVVDASSTDATVELAREGGATVIGGGGLPGPSRNLGAGEAVGEWLLFVDADVRLPPESLALLLEQAGRRALDAASCAFVPDSGGIAVRWQHRFSVEYFWLATKLGWCHSIGGCLLVRRSLHEEIGGFDTTILVAEDQDYVQRAHRAGRYAFLRRPVVEIAARRFHDQGFVRMSVKWLAIEAHRLFRGEIRDDSFRYFP